MKKNAQWREKETRGEISSTYKTKKCQHVRTHQPSPHCPPLYPKSPPIKKSYFVTWREKGAPELGILETTHKPLAMETTHKLLAMFIQIQRCNQLSSIPSYYKKKAEHENKKSHLMKVPTNKEWSKNKKAVTKYFKIN